MMFYIFSPFLRIFHWVMVLCIITLFVTGLLITKPPGLLSGDPTSSVLMVDTIRNIHFTAAYVLMAAFVLRIYGFIINKGDRLFPRFWKGSFYEECLDVALHYMLIRPEHDSYLRNPIARMSYVLLYVLVAIEFLTGFGMYRMIEPTHIGGMAFGWVNVLLGSEFMTHMVHHYVAWFIILFAIGHLYMVTRSEFMEGESEVSSMFSGSKILVRYPNDADEVDMEDVDITQRLKKLIRY
jgi:Ni/Fe-hydrogenase 1 B-type cytochrome subunit